MVKYARKENQKARSLKVSKHIYQKLLEKKHKTKSPKVVFVFVRLCIVENGTWFQYSLLNES